MRLDLKVYGGGRGKRWYRGWYISELWIIMPENVLFVKKYCLRRGGNNNIRDTR